tara:strand:- start:18 stop:323 length:306 start_codon:yes stop_codon:yes gene_type:complete
LFPLVLVAGLAASLACAASQVDQQAEIRVPDNLPEAVGAQMRVDPGDLDRVLSDSNVIFLDVRESWELEKLGTRPGYVHIPLAELELRLTELPQDKMILTA